MKRKAEIGVVLVLAVQIASAIAFRTTGNEHFATLVNAIFVALLICLVVYLAYAYGAVIRQSRRPRDDR